MSAEKKFVYYVCVELKLLDSNFMFHLHLLLVSSETSTIFSL
jgi:hypothetical protein